MKKKKVLLDGQHLFNGGSENILKNVAIFLSQKDEGNRYDVTIAAYPDKTQDFHSVFPSNIHFVRRELIKKSCARYSLRWCVETLIGKLYSLVISLYLQTKHYDISISFLTGKVMKRNSHLHARHKYCWVQRDYRDFHPWGKKYAFHTPEEELRCMRKYEKIVCVSESARVGILSTMGNPGNLVVKYNPIDYALIRKMSMETCAMRKQADRFLIVTIGRLHPEKQLLLLLQLSKSLSSVRDLEVWIVGEGGERDQLEAFIEKEDIPFVRLLGYQSNPFTYLRQADLYVSCSSSEAYGLSVQEALILNVPVVAIQCSGIEESLESRFGVLVPNDYDSMYTAIKEILENPNSLEEYRNNIATSYSVSGLFENRLESICELWEQTEK